MDLNLHSIPQGPKPLPLSNICNNKILGILHFLMIHVYYWKVSNEFYDNDKRKWKRFEQGLDLACVTIRTMSFTPTPHIQQYNLGNYALCHIHTYFRNLYFLAIHVYSWTTSNIFYCNDKSLSKGKAEILHLLMIQAYSWKVSIMFHDID